MSQGFFFEECVSYDTFPFLIPIYYLSGCVCNPISGLQTLSVLSLLQHRRDHTLLRPEDIPLPPKCDEEAGPALLPRESDRQLDNKASGSVQTRVCVNRDRSNFTHTHKLGNRGAETTGCRVTREATTTILPDQVSCDDKVSSNAKS